MNEHSQEYPNMPSPLSEEQVSGLAEHDDPQAIEADKDAHMKEFMAEQGIIPERIAKQARLEALKVVAEKNNMHPEVLETIIVELDKILDDVATNLRSTSRPSPRDLQERNRYIVESQYGKPSDSN